MTGPDVSVRNSPKQMVNNQKKILFLEPLGVSRVLRIDTGAPGHAPSLTQSYFIVVMVSPLLLHPTNANGCAGSSPLPNAVKTSGKKQKHLNHRSNREGREGEVIATLPAAVSNKKD